MSSKVVYLDNAASTPIHPEVIAKMVEVLHNGVGNPSSTHSAGRKSKAIIEQSRKTIAGILGVSPLEIVFTSCGTEANNMALKGAVNTYDVKHIISSPLEHKCVKETVKNLSADLNVRLHYLNVDEKGQIDLIQLKALLGKLEGKKLVAIMHANNEIGTFTDMMGIGEMCKEQDALFLSDTVQSMGQYPMNLTEMKVDYCSGSAHKFYGPKSVGFLYMRQEAKIPALLNGGGQERGYRSGTENVAGIAGMALAMELWSKNQNEYTAHIKMLKEHAVKGFKEKISGVEFNGDLNNSLNKLLSLRLPKHYQSDTFMFSLDLAGVHVSAGSACSSGASTGSYVLDAIGCPPDTQTIRMSFSIFNTKEDVDFAIEQIVTLGKQVLA